MTIARKKIGLFLAASTACILCLGFFLYPREPHGDLKKETFLNLKELRVKKKKEVTGYFNSIYRIAKNVSGDKTLLRYFEMLQTSGKNSGNSLELNIDRHYVERYSNFYDILFIDRTGYVFHSIKQESDYHSNLFSGKLTGTRLAESLRKKTNDQFIEYEPYSPSGEAAAFFVVPVNKSGTHSGWFVLQCSINKLNKILTENGRPGRTGEIYLVNNKKLMLSESRFIEDSTILKLKVDTLAVKEALKNKKGERIIKDYRGTRVFSSYEQFDIFGSSWIIIAEIDESEVITELYKKYRAYFREKIPVYLSSLPHKQYTGPVNSHNTTYINMNEYKKALPGSRLGTKGISSCTGVAIVYPEKFGYLVHLSPTDSMYSSNPFVKIFLKDRYSDFLGEITGRIIHYNVYQSELNRLRFTMIAPHKKSFHNFVDRLLEKGINLSNIQFMYNPRASSANMTLHMDSNKILVEWNNTGIRLIESSWDVEDLGTIVKKIINYNG